MKRGMLDKKKLKQQNFDHKINQSKELKLKNQKIINLRILENSKEKNEQHKQVKDKILVQIKDFKLKLNNFKSFSQNKLKKRKLSILSNLYRNKNQNNEQNQVFDYIQNKSVNLIKQNIKKLQIQFPHAIPKLFKHSNQGKSSESNFSKVQSNTERDIRKNMSKSGDDIFMFQDNVLLTDRSLVHRRVVNHFDRMKYFKGQIESNKEVAVSYFHPRQKGQYNKLNVKIQKEKHTNREIHKNKEKGQREDKKQRQNKEEGADEIQIPMMRERWTKPKTAGGFLKKYDLQQVCMKPNFQIHINQNQLF